MERGNRPRAYVVRLELEFHQTNSVAPRVQMAAPEFSLATHRPPRLQFRSSCRRDESCRRGGKLPLSTESAHLERNRFLKFPVRAETIPVAGDSVAAFADQRCARIPRQKYPE